MNIPFSEALRRLRIEKGLSQQQLAESIYVDRSTVAKWENGTRVPDAVMLSQLSARLGVDVRVLMDASAASGERPNVIMVDDEKIILTGGLPLLRKAMPEAEVTGFTRPSDALTFARARQVSLAFLDIEMGKVSGLELCRQLLEINPRTNVFYLTAYSEYALDAWSTGACGFMLKPLSPEALAKQLKRLRYPMRGLRSLNREDAGEVARP
ncbi:MAG: response regulator [Clostridia bacterium]|nr:response regulator [Clostridia bacterium]